MNGKCMSLDFDIEDVGSRNLMESVFVLALDKDFYRGYKFIDGLIKEMSESEISNRFYKVA